ncbi:hypothetical protein ACIREO_13080 [Streptomyces sp. NPDC102441]|uniref:hypothetical protein n=1 Tax=Streptomyces sp. NPDC102441 TaxID=3366176 RepID=UPI0038123D46
MRVPPALTGPGFTGGGPGRRPVGTVDLMPTRLEAAGIAVRDRTGRPAPRGALPAEVPWEGVEFEHRAA